jgi:hypothetical protein
MPARRAPSSASAITLLGQRDRPLRPARSPSSASVIALFGQHDLPARPASSSSLPPAERICRRARPAAGVDAGLGARLEAVDDAAARVKAIVEAARSASLATHALDPAGYPYASLVAVAWDGQGRALLSLSALAEHTKNLVARSEASLLVVEAAAPGGDPLEDPLARGRVTLLGDGRIVEPAERSPVRDAFLAAHPSAARYIDFADFALYRLEPRSVRYVGGFGKMTWLDAAAYRSAFAREP